MNRMILIISIVIFSAGLGASERLVTVGGCVTETVCELGYCQNIVAVDVTSELRGILRPSVPKLGYFTKLSGEGVLAFKPTRMIAIKTAGPATALEQIRGSQVPVTLVNDGFSLSDSLERIRQVGMALDEKVKANQLAGKVKAEVTALEKTLPAKKPGILFIYARGARMVMTGGKNTSAEEYIRLMGGRNVIDVEGFKPISAEAVITARPDIILIPAGSLFSLNKNKKQVMKSLLSLPGVAATPAGKKRAVVTIDDSLMCGMGPRTASEVKKSRSAMLKLLNK